MFLLFVIAESTVGKYDALVYCSKASQGFPTFDFNVKIPNRGSKNKLFSVTLADSHTTVSYYVTTYTYSSALIQNTSLSLHKTEETTTTKAGSFYALLVILGAIGFAFGLLYFLISYRLIVISRVVSLGNSCYYKEAKQRFLVITYCIYKIVYSVIFSLSVLVLLLQLACGSSLETIRRVPDYHLEVKHLVERNIQAITKFKHSEIDRQNDMKNQRWQACSDYASQSVASLRTYIYQYSNQLEHQKNLIEDKKFQLLMKEIQSYLLAIRVHVDKVLIFSY